MGVEDHVLRVALRVPHTQAVGEAAGHRPQRTPGARLSPQARVLAPDEPPVPPALPCCARFWRCVLLAPASASAAGGAEVSIMDDQLLLGRSQSHVDRQMRIFRRLGSRPRAGVGLLERRDLRQRGLDDQARRLRRLQPQRPPLLLGRPGPRGRLGAPPRAEGHALHHHARRRAGRATAESGSTPRPSEFAAYAEAVARRYALAGRPLRRGQRAQPARLAASPDRRRRPGLARTSTARCSTPPTRASRPPTPARWCSPATSPRAASTGPTPDKGIRPLAFLRAMACVDRSLRPITSGRCANFRPIPADAFGHHPYKFFGSPRQRSRKGDDAAIGDGRRLLRLLDRLQARGRIVKPTRRALLGLLHRVRLPDRPARPVRGRLAAQPQPLPPGGRLPGVAHPAPARVQPVPPDRRAAAPGPRPAPLRRVPERPAVRQPAPEARPIARSPTRS